MLYGQIIKESRMNVIYGHKWCFESSHLKVFINIFLLPSLYSAYGTLLSQASVVNFPFISPFLSCIQPSLRKCCNVLVVLVFKLILRSTL